MGRWWGEIGRVEDMENFSRRKTSFGRKEGASEKTGHNTSSPCIMSSFPKANTVSKDFMIYHIIYENSGIDRNNEVHIKEMICI